MQGRRLDLPRQPLVALRWSGVGRVSADLGRDGAESSGLPNSSPGEAEEIQLPKKYIVRGDDQISKIRNLMLNNAEYDANT